VRVWIDLANSPHPLLFAPVARALRERGHDIVLTARDNAQTVELALERWPEVEVIGGASPGGRAAKARQLARRVRDLRAWAAGRRPDVALSHNSYAQIVAARGLGLRIVTAMDFEHQPANHLAFRLADRVLLPEALRGSREVARHGARGPKVRWYPGLKEELYLGDFEPDAGVLGRLGLDRTPGTAIVVARTPPSRALYHQLENPLFLEAIGAAVGQDHVRCVVLARHPEQRRALAALGEARLVVPDRAVDSRSLLHAADLVLGAGGTMTREAALLGVPTFSLFAGRPPAVDAWLRDQGRLRTLHAAADLLPIGRREGPPDGLSALRERGAALVELFVDAAVGTGGARKKPPAPRVDLRPHVHAAGPSTREGHAVHPAARD
jgi:predicted glycosyltransferase